MTSKIVVNNIESDAGVSTVFFNSDIGGTGGTLNVDGNLNVDGVISYEDITNIDSVGVITARSDVSIADKIVHTGDTNTAIRFPAADTFTVETAGSERLRIASDGNITLGYAGNSLYFQNGFNNRASRIQNGGASGSADLKFYTNNAGTEAERLRIASDGKIGVGVASPQQELDVVGSAHTVAVFRPDNAIVSAYGDASVVNNLVNLRMPYGSNPGSANNNGARWGIKFEGRNDGAGYGTDTGKSASIYAVSEDATAGYNRQVGLSFYTSPFDANQTERVRITSGGDVGIGDNDPETLLHLSKNGGQATITLEDPSNSMKATLSAGTTRLDIGTPGSHDISFFTNNAHRLRIDTSGCVRVGNTHTQTTSSNTKRIALGAKGSIWGWTSGNINGALTLADNYYWDGANNRAIEADEAAYLSLRSGSLRFGTTNSTPSAGGVTGLTEKFRITSGGDVGINETSPDTNLHISRSANQNDTHGILKIESTNTGTGSATNASLIAKNRYGWSQFMQWEEHGLRIGSRSTTTGGEGKVTVTYGADSTGAVINENGVITMPQQCGFHVVLHTSQTLTNNGTVNLWDTDASDSRSYIKNMTFNAGRFVAPVSGLYYFTAQLLLSGVQSNDDSIHIMWTKGSNNDTFSYWNTRHDGASANGSYGYGGYLPVTGSTTAYLSANEIFGIKANFTGGIGVHGTDANWGHWSGFLVG